MMAVLQPTSPPPTHLEAVALVNEELLALGRVEHLLQGVVCQGLAVQGSQGL